MAQTSGMRAWHKVACAEVASPRGGWLSLLMRQRRSSAAPLLVAGYRPPIVALTLTLAPTPTLTLAPTLTLTRSFGLIMLEMLLGKFPYPHQENYFRLLSLIMDEEVLSPYP